MDIIINKNVSTYSQIKGFGEIVSSFNLIVNGSHLLDSTDPRRFLLSAHITANGKEYNYSNIYTADDIQPNGDIIIGEITIIGEATLETIDIQAKVVYLEEASY